MSLRLRAAGVVAAGALALAPVAAPLAQAAPGAEPPPVLTGRDAAVAGGFAAAALLAIPVERSLALRLQRPAVQENRALKVAAVVAEQTTQPGLYVILPAVWGLGRLVDDRTTAAAGLRGMEAVGVALTVVGVTKFAFGRARPYVAHDPTSWRFLRGLRGSEYRSFPSGHSASAFAAASALTAELAAARPSLRWAAGVPLYLGAATAGWSRMYDDRHWATDVLAGAAVGTVSGIAVTRWHRARPDGRLDRAMLGVGVELAGGPRLLVTPMRAPARRVARAGHGIFVLARVGGVADARIAELQARYDPKLARESPPHVTLVGSSGAGPILPDTPREAVRAALAPIAADTPPLALRFHAPHRFMQTNIVVLPLDPHGPIRVLHDRLAAAGLRHGRARFTFTPHATLSFYPTLPPERFRELLAVRIDAPAVLESLVVSYTRAPQPAVTWFEIALSGSGER
ncbi:phosphatase PAP2 family protein [Roseisolibacter sp. H3M3-2]|uniref:phosphatase PAP2 family protein n=1 Tax=Roseisolibacter sp. H3M3-2 TaxID=3031323 RepID=UPI0023DCDE16|nr:phosphatase PAP2 family protein [Roseisolibacter sp. H3M3-2]MDF1501551.1 phosphatase PAP2 family protein [Roseisolibacter sp. H3M3-2]